MLDNIFVRLAVGKLKLTTDFLYEKKNKGFTPAALPFDCIVCVEPYQVCIMLVSVAIPTFSSSNFIVINNNP